MAENTYSLGRNQYNYTQINLVTFSSSYNNKFQAMNITMNPLRPDDKRYAFTGHMPDSQTKPYMYVTTKNIIMLKYFIDNLLQNPGFKFDQYGNQFAYSQTTNNKSKTITLNPHNDNAGIKDMNGLVQNAKFYLGFKFGDGQNDKYSMTLGYFDLLQLKSVCENIIHNRYDTMSTFCRAIGGVDFNGNIIQSMIKAGIKEDTPNQNSYNSYSNQGNQMQQQPQTQQNNMGGGQPPIGIPQQNQFPNQAPTPTPTQPFGNQSPQQQNPSPFQQGSSAIPNFNTMPQ